MSNYIVGSSVEREFILDLDVREVGGSAGARKVRREGKIPAVVYGRGLEAISVAMNYQQFDLLGRVANSTQVFTLRSADSGLNGKSALVKEIQKQFLTSKVLHVDLLMLKEGQTVTVKVPLHITGEASGVKNSGGVLAVARHDIELDCLPKAIPHFLEVDISTLEIGDSIHASSLKLPEGATLSTDADETIVSCVYSRTATSQELQAGHETEVLGATDAAAGATEEGKEKDAKDKEAKKD